MECQLIDPAAEWPFTPEWYAARGRAPHLEQPVHQPRFEAAQAMISHAVRDHQATSVVDLGCGDGGLLSLLARTHPDVKAWGYDLQPSNIDGARQDRHVDVRYANWLEDPVYWADLAVITEVLEHLQNPHQAVRVIAENCRLIVASSPASETVDSHDPCHAWVWDAAGYRRLIEQAGFEIVEHRITAGHPSFQVVLGIQP